MMYFFISMLVAGFYVNVDSIPVWFRWLQYTTPVRYLYDALLVNEFKDTDEEFSAPSNSFETELEQMGFPIDDEISGNEVLDSQNLVFESVWINVAVLLAFAVGFRFVAYFILKRSTRLKT